jgi:hypothetical protein
LIEECLCEDMVKIKEDLRKILIKTLVKDYESIMLDSESNALSLTAMLDQS